jgi:uncharacterized membrane protein YvbJ
MSYCPKCGNQIDDVMAFCPHCGTSLKGAATPDQVPPAPLCRDKTSEIHETDEKTVHPEKGEKQKKSEYGFLGYLIGGLILITIGIFALLDLTTPSINSGQDLAAMLLIIGIIIIIGAVYVATRQMDILRNFKRFISKPHN